jgi:hypothetical protein
MSLPPIRCLAVWQFCSNPHYLLSSDGEHFLWEENQYWRETLPDLRNKFKEHSKLALMVLRLKSRNVRFRQLTKILQQQTLLPHVLTNLVFTFLDKLTVVTLFTA